MEPLHLVMTTAHKKVSPDTFLLDFVYQEDLDTVDLILFLF